MKNKKINISERKELSERIKDICIVILSIILFVYLVLGINSMIHGDKMGFFNLRFYIMSSNSTETNSSLGDLVVAKKTNISKIKKDDDIIYKRNNRMYVKKVIRTDSDNGGNIYIENDNVISNETVKDVEIMGKVLFKVGGFGNIAMFIQSPIGALNMAMIAVCIFLIIKKMTRNSQDSNGDDDDNNEKSTEERVIKNKNKDEI